MRGLGTRTGSRNTTRHVRPTIARAVVAATVVWALAGTACSPTTTPPPTVGVPEPVGMPWLKATRGDRPGIFDEFGRQVVLRGPNLNHLGDYFSSDPALPTNADLTETDWDQLDAQGVNVVRLVTTWSAWEPTRGSFDLAYLERVKDAVAAARDHGIYVVIDMHQDAWSKFVFTPRAETCPEGRHHQIGWDGAPEWATFTDGKPTCTPASREESPAVIQAWNNFYRNREGIRSELTALWGRIATEFATDSTVAGFDMLNEPGTGSTVEGTLVGLNAFYRETIAAIRAAERSVGSAARGHMIMFETTVHGAWPTYDLSPDTNLVFAPHNYAESIGPQIPGLMGVLFGLLRLLGSLYKTPVWIGEYGFWGDNIAPRMEKFAALDDAGLGAGGAGGTWWQWEQECGDPHDVSGVYPPDAAWVEKTIPTCGRDGGSLHCSDRPFPRAVPGRLISVRAECRGHLEVRGTSTDESTAEIWFPGPPGPPPSVTGDNSSSLTTTAVDGGWIITVRAGGDYRITVDA